jgi:hypothetical protein
MTLSGLGLHARGKLLVLVLVLSLLVLALALLLANGPHPLKSNLGVSCANRSIELGVALNDGRISI